MSIWPFADGSNGREWRRLMPLPAAASTRLRRRLAMPRKTDDYEVGYGKPPKHSQFPPGVSGNKGRRRRAETPAEIIARIRDDKVMVNGKRVSKIELAINQEIGRAHV